MKWEETVIKIKWMSPDVQKDQDALLAKQAEISFKAGRIEGIKEVTDWMKENGYTNKGILHTHTELWQKQVKEWGIDVNTGRD